MSIVEKERLLRSSAPLWEAFRRGDECIVMSLLQKREELRHIDNEGALRAACWYGMEVVARYLVECCAAAPDADLLCMVRMRGYKVLAVWMDEIIMLRAGKDIKKLQLSFIA